MTTIKKIVHHLKEERQLLFTVVLVMAGLAVFFQLDMDKHALRFLEWLNLQEGPWAPLLFILVDALVVVLVLPGVLLTLGAGFMFGVIHGGMYVVIATTLGGGIGFYDCPPLSGDNKTGPLLSVQSTFSVNSQSVAAPGLGCGSSYPSHPLFSL